MVRMQVGSRFVRWVTVRAMGCVWTVLGRLTALEVESASNARRLSSIEDRLEFLARLGRTLEADVDALGTQVAEQDTFVGSLREDCGDFFELVREEFREMGRMDEQA